MRILGIIFWGCGFPIAPAGILLRHTLRYALRTNGFIVHSCGLSLNTQHKRAHTLPRAHVSHMCCWRTQN